MKLLCILLCLVQRLVEPFNDDEPFDPTWMDYKAWKETREG